MARLGAAGRSRSKSRDRGARAAAAADRESSGGSVITDYLNSPMFDSLYPVTRPRHRASRTISLLSR